ncbi:hypothetical protein FA13DRAFT_1777151 [Coprinellus micaceus]|uniref:Yeast cell wall synthesis Kre9/Knh1-like N-terminal domain-containing protein n=1 Tax=Coprinellus micaceus TaxID=71717 RepID=A0A4Y7SW96_COPMI|nr:hypothetical protein FA13DRAFT_1777151 [Coprinellus micaceus]
MFSKLANTINFSAAKREGGADPFPAERSGDCGRHRGAQRRAQLTPLALATLTWDTAPGDPELFTLEIVNEEFNDAFAIASNIDSDQGSIIVIIPVVPVRGGYTLEAVNVGNTNDVYSKTGTFNVV